MHKKGINTDNYDSVILSIFIQITRDYVKKYITHIDTDNNNSFIPITKIINKTFKSYAVSNKIMEITKKNINQVNKCLLDNKIQQYLLSIWYSNRLHYAIITNNMQLVFDCVNTNNYQIDTVTLMYAVINDRYEIINYLLSIPNTEKNITISMLNKCIEYGYISMYDLLKNFINSTSLVLTKITKKTPIEIYEQLINKYSFDKKSILHICEYGTHEMIKMAITTILEDDIKFPSEAIWYIILSKNLLIVKYCFLMLENICEFNIDCYYAALLSGDKNIIEFIEGILQIKHLDERLDEYNSNIQKNPFDVTYMRNNKKYISHCMNYAVQSGNINIVEYIYQKGYGISISNIINSIYEKNVNILSFLVTKYNKILPQYVLVYFSITNAIYRKIDKLNILVDNNKIDIKPHVNLTMHDYEKIKYHKEEMLNRKIKKHNIYDTDCVLKYYSYYNEDVLTAHDILITKLRYYIIHNMKDRIAEIIINAKLNYVTITTTFMLYSTNVSFGPLAEFLCSTKILTIKTDVVNELLYQKQLYKICWFLAKNILTTDVMYGLKQLAWILNDNDIYTILNKPEKVSFDMVVHMRDIILLVRYIDLYYPNIELNINMHTSLLNSEEMFDYILEIINSSNE